MAMAREEKRRVLSGQYRFTEWVATKNEAIPGTRQVGGIPPEIVRWYTHFEGKGIPAAIVRRRDRDMYAVIRQGVDHAAAWEEEPDLIDKTDIYVLRKCHGFALSVQEY
jgi:hypothetical protein